MSIAILDALACGVTFDAAAHRFYRDDGRELPGTTRILKDRGLIDATWFTEDAQLRGSDFHKRTEIIDAGDAMAFLADDVKLAGKLRGYGAFVDDYDPMWTVTEAVIGDPFCGYAGIVDRVGILRRVACRCCNGPKQVTLDFKTGGPMDWHPLQVAGAYNRRIRSRHAACLYLHDDGSYRMKYYDDLRGAERRFLTEVRAWHEQRR